jgi:hypothetical protein
VIYEAARRWTAGSNVFLRLVDGSVNLASVYGIEPGYASLVVNSFKIKEKERTMQKDKMTDKRVNDLLVIATMLLLQALLALNPSTSGFSHCRVGKDFTRNILGFNSRLVGMGCRPLPTFDTLQERMCTAATRYTKDIQVAAGPVPFTSEYGLTWKQALEPPEGQLGIGERGNAAEQGDTGEQGGARVMEARDAHDALDLLASKLRERLHRTHIDVAAGCTHDSEMGGKPKKELIKVVEEKLDFGESSSSFGRVIAITGPVWSKEFANEFMDHARSVFRFANPSGGNRLGRVSSRKAGQVFEVKGLMYRSYQFTDVEERLCRIGENLMKPATNLLQEYCCKKGILFNENMRYRADMMHMTYGPFKDSSYSKHDDSGCFLCDEQIPEKLMGGRRPFNRADMQVLTLVFSNATESDGVWLVFYDTKGKPIGKILCVGDMIHYQSYGVQLFAEHAVEVLGSSSGDGYRLVVTLRFTSPFQLDNDMLLDRLRLFHPQALAKPEQNWISYDQHR